MIEIIKFRDQELRKHRQKLSWRMFNKNYWDLSQWEEKELRIQIRRWI